MNTRTKVSHRKAMIESICHYVLSQDHERENLIKRFVSRLNFSTYEEETIRCIYYERTASIYYSACVLLYGKREANKMYRECIEEAMK